MEVNSVNMATQVEQQNINTENREPKTAESTEAPEQTNREAYSVNISQEALQAQTQTQTEQTPPESVNSVEQGSEAVQAYTRAGQLAG